MTHLNSQGFFVSDKYIVLHHAYMSCRQDANHKCGTNKLVLSLKDPEAELAIRLYAKMTSDWELGKDILKALDNLK